MAQGALRNVSFRDMVHLLEGFGFGLIRVNGSHHIFSHPAVKELVNLQEVGGEAKPYQIRQFMRLIERYNITLHLRKSDERLPHQYFL
jgi:predicted RNA binding protein YcfA (HicA-like mRNA interferase family)